MTDKTSLGDRMKMYEAPFTSTKVFRGQVLVARLDGKSFHNFTKGLKRPYDERLSTLMVNTTRELVDRFNANIGYTQSDEITLVWHIPTHQDALYPFDGRVQKMVSLLAAHTTAFFNKKMPTALPEKEDLMPSFDCRVFIVPTLQEACNNLIWRQQDATKNAISMAAQSMFSHKKLQNKNGAEMQEMMFQEHGVNFNDYPPFFKRGTFVRREKLLKNLTADELSKIPESHRPTGPVVRTEVRTLDMWLQKVSNSQVDVVFNGVEPEYEGDFK